MTRLVTSPQRGTRAEDSQRLPPWKRRQLSSNDEPRKVTAIKGTAAALAGLTAGRSEGGSAKRRDTVGSQPLCFLDRL